MLLRNILRTIFSVFFLIGAFVNGTTVFLMPEVYASFAQDAFFPFYTHLWASLVFPHIQLWILLVVLFELTLCVLLLSEGVRTRTGLLVAAVFMFLLVPFWWNGASLFNVWFGLTMLWLSRTEFPQTIGELLKNRKS